MSKGFNLVSTTSDRLKEAMRLTGKKQVDLVRETGIDKGSISHYVSGKYEPKDQGIHKLAVALDVSEMWLWGYDVPMERPQTQKEVGAVDAEQKEKPTNQEADELSKAKQELIAKIMTLPEDKVKVLLSIAESIEQLYSEETPPAAQE